MGDRRIAGYETTTLALDVGEVRVALRVVENLERYVDREALLRAEDPPEPPYWAHLWAGARVLAEAVPRGAGRVVEVGCGLGLPGVVATLRGACQVVFADRVAAPLAFVRRTLADNGAPPGAVVVADFIAAPWRDVWDLVLAAEILYDRQLFGAIAKALATMLAPGGRVLLTDGHRIDTSAFYGAIDATGLRWASTDVMVGESGARERVSLVEMWCPSVAVVNGPNRTS